MGRWLSGESKEYPHRHYFDRLYRHYFDRLLSSEGRRCCFPLSQISPTMEPGRRLPGSSIFPRHKRRSCNRRGYINRLLVFRETPEVRYEIGKGREQPHSFFHRLGGTSWGGNKSAELLQRPCLGVELVQPQELSLLIDLQKPPLPVVVHCKINRAKTDL